MKPYFATKKRKNRCQIRGELCGLYADKIAIWLREASDYTRRGEYNIMDKSVGNLVNTVVFQCPSKLGKGVLVSPTVHGNLLIGPNAEDIEERDNFQTTEEGLRYVNEWAARSVKLLPKNAVITAFTGLRARCDRDEFIIEEAPDAKGFFNVAGIESPGLTSAPAIAEYVVELIKERVGRIRRNLTIQLQGGRWYVLTN